MPGAAVGIVLAAAGYPDAPRRGDAIEGLEGAAAGGALVFHAGTAVGADGTVRTAGGRVLAVVGRGPDLDAARGHGRSGRGRDRASTALQRRHDIGAHDAAAAAAAIAGRRDDPALHARRDGRDLVREARFEAMLRVELAVARAQAARGLVPADALAAIERAPSVDVERIAEIERTTDHDVIAFVSQVAETVGPEGRYLHLGLTSSDVVDTGLALQLRAAGERLLADCDQLSRRSSPGPGPRPTP